MGCLQLCLKCCKGLSTFDVSSEGEGGYPLPGGCVNSILKICTKCGQGGRGGQQSEDFADVICTWTQSCWIWVGNCVRVHCSKKNEKGHCCIVLMGSLILIPPPSLLFSSAVVFATPQTLKCYPPLRRTAGGHNHCVFQPNVGQGLAGSKEMKCITVVYGPRG